MSYREPFYIFPRKMKSGKTIFYYQSYLPDGKLSNARSTGQKTKGAAKAYCRVLKKENRLIPPEKLTSLIFSNYFENWWVWGPEPDQPSLCPYLTRKFVRGQKPSFAHSKVTLNKYKKHVLPYFSDMDITEIKLKDVELWLDSIALKGLSGKSQVNLLSILRIMMREARRLGDI